MRLLKYLLVKLLLSSIFVIGCIGQTAFAKTDDAKWSRISLWIATWGYWMGTTSSYGDIYHGYDKYTGYYVGEYVGYHNEGLSFVFNKYTKYWEN